MVFELLRDMIVETLGCEEGDVTPKSELREDLGLSDTQLEEVMEAMSGELGFRYESHRLEDILTVAQLVRYIAGLI